MYDGGALHLRISVTDMSFYHYFLNDSILFVTMCFSDYFFRFMESRLHTFGIHRMPNYNTNTHVCVWVILGIWRMSKAYSSNVKYFTVIVGNLTRIKRKKSPNKESILFIHTYAYSLSIYRLIFVLSFLWSMNV